MQSSPNIVSMVRVSSSVVVSGSLSITQQVKIPNSLRSLSVVLSPSSDHVLQRHKDQDQYSFSRRFIPQEYVVHWYVDRRLLRTARTYWRRLRMKLSVFDLPRGSKHFIELPSGRCVNVHHARVNNNTVQIHVQSNSEQWPAIYSDTLSHCFLETTIYHSASKNLSHEDITYLQTYFPHDYWSWI
jgi:hypothetical protein